MDSLSFATLRLGKDSVDDINHINAHQPGIIETQTEITVTCTQVPTEFDVGTIVFLWLGSDNNKGMPTAWKQGFKTVGQVEEIQRGEKYNDESIIVLNARYVFPEAVNRLDILQKAPMAYYWCSAMPVIGLDDHSNQTVRMIVADTERSDIKAFLYSLNAVQSDFKENIIQVFPELQELFQYKVPDPNEALVAIPEPGKLSPEEIQRENARLKDGQNALLYGVPGSGKSWTIEHEYCHSDSRVERLVFHPDYTYSDFIGQILPSVADDGQVSYEFTPGPFTQILKEAYWNPGTEYILVIEEINRGNAPAIFGEVFQLLDRKTEKSEENDDGYPIGTSEYGITNANIAKIVYDDPTKKVRIPSNLSIIGTMNTSDQNVFTLDTAFQRRWDMRLIENNFETVDQTFANTEILDTGITWEVFCKKINEVIVGNNVRMSSSEDKRLGAYFVRVRDLQMDDRMGDALSTGKYDDLRKEESSGEISDDHKNQLAVIREALKQNRRFPEKVIKYLWDDAFKFNREILFDTAEYRSLESVIRAFMYAEGIDRFKMFKPNIVDALQNPDSGEEE